MKYLKTASVLAVISLICAAIIAAFSLLTSQKIKDNSKQKEQETYKVIYDDYSYSKDVTKNLSKETLDYDLIEKAIIAYDVNDNELGTIFTVTGKNSYGTISLMVAVNDGNVSKVEFLANTESFASKVNDYVKSNYPSSKTDAIYIGINDSKSNDIDSLSIDNVSDMDTKCGATYGALLVKKLVLAAASAEILS
jgi:anionic cell wall polymer biosynthesis LytR-Cps2A-Psr (LCP) family protein